MAAAAEGMFKGMCGTLYGCDTEVDRHPYHRNCNCALHRSRNASASANANSKPRNCPRGLPKSKTVSYPIRKSWSEGCLALAAASSSSSPSPSSSSSSPASSPAVGLPGRHRRLSSLDEAAEEEDGGGVFFKV